MLQGHLISWFALLQFLITDHEILVKVCPKTTSLGETVAKASQTLLCNAI